MTAGSGACFHCQEPLPETPPVTAEINGQPRSFCCDGCLAVSRIIENEGLDRFYQQVDGPLITPDPVDDRVRAECLHYNDQRLTDEVVHTRDDDLHETWLMVEGLSCAACIWLIENHLARFDGLESIRINHSTQRAHLVWNPETTSLGHLLLGIRELGFQASPFRPGEWEETIRAQQKQAMIRIGIAGIAALQTMMLAYPLQFGLSAESDPAMVQLFRWASLVIATPVVLYSAVPFFQAAVRDLRYWHPGMDVPVSIAILAGYIASLHVTVFGGEHVYFESISMFTFFLGLGRFLEGRARYRAGLENLSLINAMPGTAIRMEGNDETVVGARDLNPGDCIRIRPGDTLAADGHVVSGHSSVDESMLTGESLPVTRGPGDPVSAGTINTEHPLEVVVDQAGDNTRLSAITRLLDRAQAEKPRTQQVADRVAGAFVTAVLAFAAATWLVWWFIDPERAFPVTLAVLVATCPCALSLATPTALTVATNRLRRTGFVPTRGTTLETLNTVNTLVFDKTGTLTCGQLSIAAIDPFHGNTEAQCRALAAGLEQGSEHPIARAFRNEPAVSVSNRENHPGGGVTGFHGGRKVALGRVDFVATELNLNTPPEMDEDAALAIQLADDTGWLGRITLDDTLRADAEPVLATLRSRGWHCVLLSGDHSGQVARVAQALGINHCEGRLSPEAKLARIRALEADGHRVMMVGDGLNDLPGLAGARLSVAMAGSSDIARLRADAVVLGERLSPLLAALKVAPLARRVIRQNLSLSLLYNAAILPLAMAGLVIPWIAAAGMSASSVVVVMNALRLGGASRDGNTLYTDSTVTDTTGNRRQAPDLGGTQRPVR
ncbi:heavy metal translocating P-type ATPase [Salicola sp. Rm-C-2C1-2]|uniref:heavy metal translocating P-type ATPase n=1 Tax=Salicola sp. Rm-C-2C1-2 TaxID=3141321 RepID=UPI0032E4064B